MVAIGAAVGIAGILVLPLVVPGILLVAFGLVLAGPASRPLRRGREEGRRLLEQSAIPKKRTIIVGAGEVAQALARELEQTRRHVVIGFVEDGGQPGAELRILGTRDELLELAEQHGADQIIIAETPSWQQKLLERTMNTGRHRLEVQLVPSLYETAIGRLPRLRVSDIPLLSVSPWQRGRSYEGFRRAADVTFSLMALGLSAPLIGFAALAVKLTSRGPVLFRQDRVGMDGSPFVMFKLRTMFVDAERDGPSLCSGYDDSRLTSVGRLLRRTRLDEIPQFINVLRGEMSVIGPRPERPCFVQQFEQEIPGYRERHRIRPGITGLAQVNGSYLSNARVKLRYDLFYLYHRSIWLDLLILARTFGAMIH
jgi:exopolysaccharide biosynthesis polyprenyl glycosylphosphotransferase